MRVGTAVGDLVLGASVEPVLKHWNELPMVFVLAPTSSVAFR